MPDGSLSSTGDAGAADARLGAPLERRGVDFLTAAFKTNLLEWEFLDSLSITCAL